MNTPETFEDMVRQIHAQSFDTMIDKQLDYGPGNITEFGQVGVLVRAFDKVHRLKHLLESGGNPANESVEDSWLDLMNYALIGLCVMRGWWTKNGCPPLIAGLQRDLDKVLIDMGGIVPRPIKYIPGIKSNETENVY